MKKLHTMIVAAALALATVGCIAGCETKASSLGREMAANAQNVFTTDVLPGLSQEAVKNSILAALAERKWTVTEQSEGRIAAELDASAKRGVHGIIVITFDETTVTITDSSTNSNGQLFVPVRWIKYLQRSIDKSMQLELATAP
ncbi:MAG TPA: hypothetical protein PKI32_08540 [Opitutales bacterium]|nr:hypothetical protein [Opitutales bacterium]